MTALSKEQIETLNAYGPYNHAVWQSNGVAITNEERLQGRGERLVEVIRSALLQQFTLDQIAELRILDIGCYDGWLLHQLSELPFREMIGVEPRQKNIDKGEKVREILGIDCRVQFRVGTLESLPDDPFDVVLCIGLLHHLPSLAAAFEKIQRVCKQMLFVDTLCLSDRCTTSAFQREIELKDIIYQFKPQQCGIVGHKYESAYYDGSASQTGVVSVPSVDTLSMYLDNSGFGQIETLISPEQYRQILQPGGREGNAICLSAVKETRNNDDEQAWISEYEVGLLRTQLDSALIAFLANRLGEVPEVEGEAGSLGRLVTSYVSRSSAQARRKLRSIRRRASDRFEFEILKNLRFNPYEKIRLEWGKQLYTSQQSEQAISILESITGRLNADWRATYRAFFLLSRCYDRLGQEATAERYRDFCRTSNPKFPLEALNDY